MARKGLAVKVAVGKPSDLGAPSGFGVTAKKTIGPAGVTRSTRVAVSPRPDEEEDEPELGDDEENGEDEEEESSGTATAPSPEAVHYHDELQRCDLCSHFGDDGQCEVLQMQVQAEGGCSAFDGMVEGEPEASPFGGESPIAPMRRRGYVG